MINLIQSTSKWPKILRSDTAYLQSFNKAILNFEKNVMEDGDRVSGNKLSRNRIKGTRN